MTDINKPKRHSGDRPPDTGAGQLAPDLPPIADHDPALLELVELLFFAYRDFTGDPDIILQEYAFGRAHHRVLHFVGRYPGLRVADLLDILKITKQSLARVLKQLIDEGYIEQQTGALDRRERRLHVTPKGQALAGRLLAPQIARVKAAIGRQHEGSMAQSRQFLYNMINKREQAAVNEMFDRAIAAPEGERRRRPQQPARNNRAAHAVKATG